MKNRTARQWKLKTWAAYNLGIIDGRRQGTEYERSKWQSVTPQPTGRAEQVGDIDAYNALRLKDAELQKYLRSVLQGTAPKEPPPSDFEALPRSIWVRIREFVTMMKKGK